MLLFFELLLLCCHTPSPFGRFSAQYPHTVDKRVFIKCTADGNHNLHFKLHVFGGLLSKAPVCTPLA